MRPFEGLRILDLTHVLAGPFCAYQFALLGADVIKIENPNDPDCARGRGPDPAQNSAGRGLTYQVQGSNKRALAIDFKTEDGQTILKDLAKDAAALIENYRTGALDDLGLGYNHLQTINPSLVYCSMTGFGNSGDRAEVNAYDNVIQASSGIIDQTGGVKPGLSFVDYAAGYNAAFAVSAALFRRAQTGEGTYISCSMFETALTMMSPELSASLYPIEAKSNGKEAGISSYETSDGILMLGTFTPKQNNRLWSGLAADGMATADQQSAFGKTKDWQDLWEINASLKEALTKIFEGHSAAWWQDWLHDAGLPGERIRSLEEAARDPQLQERHFLHQGVSGSGDRHQPHLPVAAYQFNKEGPVIHSPPPGIGEHTQNILSELGYSQERIKELKRKGVIA